MQPIFIVLHIRDLIPHPITRVQIVIYSLTRTGKLIPHAYRVINSFTREQIVRYLFFIVLYNNTTHAL